MLPIEIPGDVELFDEVNMVFIPPKHPEPTTIVLEHSLVSISKWEAKWHKPFLAKGERTEEESIDYIRCMTITQHVSPDVYDRIPPEAVGKIQAYIEDSMTATTFSRHGEKSREGRSRKKNILTNEVIYYYMFSLGIPKECEKWHLNRLLTLIEVFDAKSEKPKKMNKKALSNRNAALNAQRCAALGSKG